MKEYGDPKPPPRPKKVKRKPADPTKVAIAKRRNAEIRALGATPYAPWNELQFERWAAIAVRSSDRERYQQGAGLEQLLDLLKLYRKEFQRHGIPIPTMKGRHE